MDVNERIEALRRLMEEKGIDIYIVPTADYHQSESVRQIELNKCTGGGKLWLEVYGRAQPA